MSGTKVSKSAALMSLGNPQIQLFLVMMRHQTLWRSKTNQISYHKILGFNNSIILLGKNFATPKATKCLNFGYYRYVWFLRWQIINDILVKFVRISLVLHNYWQRLLLYGIDFKYPCSSAH